MICWNYDILTILALLFWVIHEDICDTHNSYILSVSLSLLEVLSPLLLKYVHFGKSRLLFNGGSNFGMREDRSANGSGILGSNKQHLVKNDMISYFGREGLSGDNIALCDFVLFSSNHNHYLVC